MQVMYDKGKYECPLKAPADTAGLRPLILGLPAALKGHALSKKEEIERVVVTLIFLLIQMFMGEVITWTELLRDIFLLAGQT